jgi:hypothetical protein
MMSAAEILNGDKGYDSDAVRRKIESKGAAPNNPPKANRRWKEELLLPSALSQSQRRRAHVWAAQGFPQNRHTIRSPRP